MRHSRFTGHGIVNETDKKNTIGDINDLLVINEDNFNKEQEVGINFQLIKAVARKNTRNYKEKNLLPDYYYTNDPVLNEICEDNIIGLDKEDYFYSHIINSSEEIQNEILNLSEDLRLALTSSLEIRASSRSSLNLLSDFIQYFTVSGLIPAISEASATVKPEAKAFRKSSLRWADKALV